MVLPTKCEDCGTEINGLSYITNKRRGEKLLSSKEICFGCAKRYPKFSIQPRVRRPVAHDSGT